MQTVIIHSGILLALPFCLPAAIMALSTPTEVSSSSLSSLASVDPGPNNPCPVLRALVSRGDLNRDYEKPSHIGAILGMVSKRGYPPKPEVSQGLVTIVATIANGLWPWNIASTLWYGTHLSGLRGAILDKKGGGSQILSSVDGTINKSQLDRMASFGSNKIDALSGTIELGLNQNEIQHFIDANVDRAKDIPMAKPQWACKLLASAEYPVLLKVMGKPGKDGTRYLSMDEVRTLWEQRKFPSRLDGGDMKLYH
jgi:hypothetical protein